MLGKLSVLYWRSLVTSPVSKTRRRAAAALGKSHSSWAVPPLIKALSKPIQFQGRDSNDDDQTYYETRYLVEALAAIGPPAVPGLIEAFAANTDFVKAGAAEALGIIGDSRAMPALAEGLDPRFDLEIRRTAAAALKRLQWTPDDDARHVWFELLTWGSYVSQGHQAYAAEVAKRLSTRPKAFETLIQCLNERPNFSYTPSSNAERAAWVLGEFGDVRAVAPLSNILPRCQAAAAEALERLGTIDPLLDLIRQGKENIKPELLRALIRSADPRAIEPLFEYVRSRHRHLEYGRSGYKIVVEGLRQFGEPATGALRNLLQDSTAELRQSALRDLLALGWVPSSDEDRALAAFANQVWSDLPQYRELVDWILASDAPPMKQQETLISLGEIAVEPLLKHVESGNMVVVAALGGLNDLRALEPLVDLYLADRNRQANEQAIAALTRLGPLAPMVLKSKYEQLSHSQRLRVIAGLGEFPYSMVSMELSPLVRDPDEQLRTAAADATAFAVYKEVLRNFAKVENVNPLIFKLAADAIMRLALPRGGKPPIQGKITQAEFEFMQQTLQEIEALR